MTTKNGIGKAKTRNPAILAAKASTKIPFGERYSLSTGVDVVLSPVSVSLLDEAVSNIPVPQVPVYFDEDKGREVENPTSKAYAQALDSYERQRVMAVLDAMIICGVELADGLPANDLWLKQLSMLARRGVIDLSDLDLNDELDREFAYKKYIAIGERDLREIMASISASEEDSNKAKSSFQGDEEREADRSVSA